MWVRALKWYELSTMDGLGNLGGKAGSSCSSGMIVVSKWNGVSQIVLMKTKRLYKRRILDFKRVLQSESRDAMKWRNGLCW